MAKIIVICGMTASGKNKVYDEIIKSNGNLKKIVTHTTRPIREGELDGHDYYFCSDDVIDSYIESGFVFEYREYATKHGVWKYGTTLDEVDIYSNNTYISIVDLNGLSAYYNHFGIDNVESFYIHANDDLRLLRMLNRETGFNDTKKEEIIRRFHQDKIDFKNAKNVCKNVFINNYIGDFENIIDSVARYINDGI